MVVAAGTAEQKATWALIEERYAGYRLVLPGEPSFICQAELCDAHCCRAYNVALNDDEVARLAAAGPEPPSRFLECEDGEPINLPLERPFVLGRQGDHCLFLSEERTCEQYAARPDACQLYPHQIIFVEASGRPAQPSAPARQRALQSLLGGEATGGVVPLLLRQVECPGFTGAPTSAPEWATLVRATYALQWGDEATPGG